MKKSCMKWCKFHLEMLANHQRIATWSPCAHFVRTDLWREQLPTGATSWSLDVPCTLLHTAWPALFPQRQWTFILWWWNNEHLTYLYIIQGKLMHNALPLPPSPDQWPAGTQLRNSQLRTLLPFGLRWRNWLFLHRFFHSRIPDIPQQTLAGRAPKLRLNSDYWSNSFLSQVND